MSAKRHLASAIQDFYGLLERGPAGERIAKVHAELSTAASQLDADDPAEAEALRAVIAADDAIRTMGKTAVKAELQLAGAMVALRRTVETNAENYD